MNRDDLLDVIGEVRDSYILDALNSRGAASKKHVLSVHRVWLIAAVIAVALFLVGCTVACVLSLQGLKITERSVMSYIGADGRRTAPTEQTQDVLSIRGYSGSANQRATLEWFEFEEAYDPDLELMENENVHGIPDNYYYVYGCYTWEMVEKVDEICEKYGLKLLSMDTVVQRWQKDIFFDALEIDGMLLPEAHAEETGGSGIFFPEGNFQYSFEFTLTDDGAWPYEIWATVFYSQKEYFDPDIQILRIDDYDQWNYRTTNGVDVLIAYKDGNGLLFAEYADAYITVSVNTTMMLSSENSRRATREDLELASECINFTIHAKTENIAAAIPAMEAADKAHWQEQERPRLTYSHCASYSEYLLNSVGIASIKDWCAVMDINGDGIAELLQGSTPDGFNNAVTITEEGVVDYLLTDMAYPCENSIIETFHTQKNEEYYSYFKIIPGVVYNVDPDVMPEMVEYVMHDTETDLWYTGKEWRSRTQTTREEADAIRSKYPRMEMHMTPIAEYPMDEDGTTLLELTSQNTGKLTEPERMAIYAEIIRWDQEKAYIPSNFYCLRDINGDGIEDLLLGETAEYFGNAYTIFNGKRDTIHFWSRMNLCEGNVMEISGSNVEFESHSYYKLDPDGRVFIESVGHTFYPESWTKQEGLRGKEVEITQAEYDAVVASYLRIPLNMKPISEFPMN